MAKNDIMTKIGTWAFLFGILIALLVGLYEGYTFEQYLNEEIMLNETFFMSETGGAVAWVLAILGVIIGVLKHRGEGRPWRDQLYFQIS